MASTRASTNLDFLRSTAVLLVVTQHLCKRLQIDQLGWIPTSSLGWFGVLLFFVHTSLVLMYSMDRTPLSGWPLVRHFYTRRFFRIYPLSLLTVLVAVALSVDSNINGVAGLSRGSRPGWVSLLAHLLLVQNIAQVKSIVNVLWSLPFEVQMYLLLPFLFMWVRRSAAFWQLFTCWGASLICAAAQPSIAALSRASILQYIPNFLAGVIAFVLPQRFRMKSFLWPILILALVIVFASKPSDALGWVLCFVLGVLIPQFQEIKAHWLRAASKQVAKYSYGIYLSHQFCIWISLGILADRPLWLRFGFLAVLIVTLPLVLYHAVEKPMIDLGNRLANRGTAQSSVQVAQTQAA